MKQIHTVQITTTSDSFSFSTSIAMDRSIDALCTQEIPMEWISSQHLTFSPLNLHVFPLLGPSLTTPLIYARTNDDRSASTPLVPSTAVSLSMKLPRFLELFCLLPNRPPPDVFLPLELDVTPPTQRKTMARKRHTTAAHMKPKLYFPRVAVVPAELKALRPCTNAALCSVSVLVMKRKKLWTWLTSLRQ